MKDATPKSDSLPTAAQYMHRTESATRKLLDGIESYVSVLKRAPPPVFMDSFATDMDHRVAFEQWLTENEEQVRLSLKAQREYSAESFALSTLSGCLLQVAAMGIQWFSKNTTVPPNFADVIKPSLKSAAFCIGRRIRTVPIGLIIYAGRNQFAHLDETVLRDPSTTVFERLAREHGYPSDTPFSDPAFDLANEQLVNFSSNLISLMGWRSYDDYASDMSALLGVPHAFSGSR